MNPFRRMQTISDRELDRIAEIARRYMQANVAERKSEGIVTYTGTRGTTSAMDRGARLWVYRRRAQECRRCGAIIRCEGREPVRGRLTGVHRASR